MSFKALHRHVVHSYNNFTAIVINRINLRQETQLSQGDCALLRVIEYLLSHSRSIKVIPNDTLEYSASVSPY